MGIVEGVYCYLSMGVFFSVIKVCTDIDAHGKLVVAHGVFWPITLSIYLYKLLGFLFSGLIEMFRE